MAMSVVRALLQDAENCVFVPFGEEAVLCVLGHPEQFEQERVGYSIAVVRGRRCQFKDVVKGYEALVLYMQHAGVAVEKEENRR